MSTKKLAKSHDDALLDHIDAYRQSLGGGSFTMELAAEWMLKTGLVDAPKTNPVRLLTRQLKQAARSKRIVDPQGRTVRKILAAKVEKLTADGNKLLDVMWDYLYEMSLDHALIAFAQRDDNIEKQRRSATRDLESCLDNNPNLAGHRDQFRFAFMTEEPVSLAEERIEETQIIAPSSPSMDDDEDDPISKQKPR